MSDMEMDYLTDRTPVLVMGITGAGSDYGGKSALVNWWYTHAVRENWFDLGVYFNPKAENNVAISGYRIKSLTELSRNYVNGKRLFDFVPPFGVEAEAHGELMDTLRQFDGSAIVVHDEAADYADSDSLAWAIRRGGNEAGIKNIVVAQRAWDLPETIRTNCPIKVWVGPVSSDARGYFSTLGMSDAFEQIKETHDPFQWSVIGPGGNIISTNDPVPASFA